MLREKQILETALKQSTYWNNFSSVNCDELTEQFSKFLDEKSNNGELLPLHNYIEKEKQLNTNSTEILGTIVATEKINNLMELERGKIKERINNYRLKRLIHSPVFEEEIHFLEGLIYSPIALLQEISRDPGPEQADILNFLAGINKIQDEIARLTEEKRTFIGKTISEFANTPEYKVIMEKNKTDKPHKQSVYHDPVGLTPNESSPMVFRAQKGLPGNTLEEKVSGNSTPPRPKL